jgi:acylphosphatase
MNHAVHLLVSGRVQGVGFRFFAVHRASKYGVTGWVRNRADGRVEVEAEGELSRLRMFLEDIRMGPSSGYVSNVAEEWQEIEAPRHRGFSITY